MKAELKPHSRPLHAKGRILDQQHFVLISAIFHVSSFSNTTNPSHLFYINNSFANTDSFFSAMIFEKKKKKHSNFHFCIFCSPLEKQL